MHSKFQTIYFSFAIELNKLFPVFFSGFCKCLNFISQKNIFRTVTCADDSPSHRPLHCSNERHRKVRAYKLSFLSKDN